MTTFLHLGKHIVNADHIVSAKQLEPTPERQQYDPYSRISMTIKAQPIRVELTLVSVQLKGLEDGENWAGAASVSQTITVKGDLAEHLWGWLENRADVVILEPLSSADAQDGDAPLAP